jgi:hypothetical protein
LPVVRATVLDADAANRLSQVAVLLDPLDDSDLGGLGVTRVETNNIAYYLSSTATAESRLLVIIGGPLGPLATPDPAIRQECVHRILRAALSQFWPTYVKIPMSWRVYHTGSLTSFHTNRFQSGITARLFVDAKPENTNHVYAYYVARAGNEALDRERSDGVLFTEACLALETAIALRDEAVAHPRPTDLGHSTYALNEVFPAADITQGIPFTVWRDAKLSRVQRAFFDAPFDGPLRLKGPAGSGKTLVLSMRFLKEIYDRIDANQPARICFLTHGEETATHILQYLTQIDERGLFFRGTGLPGLDLEVTTLHGLANRYINRDTENVQPLSLDGAEGRTLQLELIESIVRKFVLAAWPEFQGEDIRSQFAAGLEASPGDTAHRAFCYDLSDEFANVLETLGVRALDDIATKYLQVKPSERALGKTIAEKAVILELYKHFRQQLAELNVVSLDQFTADFLAYLNSFRWDALRRDRGFDFVFADELHLFNGQERRVLGYLLREADAPRRVAVAYDPRQSPRNSFFPEAINERDTIWSEARLESSTRPFELEDVFRYTPQILRFLARLNDQFPGHDLAEDWALNFGISRLPDGDIPVASLAKNWSGMLELAGDRARRALIRASKGEQVAILCLDPERFADYRTSTRFSSGYALISGRDEIGNVGRARKRVVLSMPEYVAGLQFSAVYLIDANASLVAQLGSGVNGLHRFVSTVYLGASRAQHTLEIFADRGAGGFAEPIRAAIASGQLTEVRADS